MTTFPRYGRGVPAVVLACVLGAASAHAQPLSAGWTSGDIGNPAVAGAASIANGTFTVTGGGSDIWHRADQFQFVYQVVAGDVTIVARIASLSAADPWAKAGVMVRQSLTPGSPHMAMLGTAGSGWSAQGRQSSDGLTTDSSGPSGTPPGWVRLVRAGNVVTASHSYDGNTWSVVSSHTVAMSSSVYVGLAVTGHNGDGATARATFQNVTVQGTSVGSPGPSPTPPAGSPPSGWASSDIGNPAGAGAVSIANGTFTVTGGGSDIWHRADQFQFVYQAVAGDVAIVARIASLSAADPWAKAGVMIRQSLTPGSPHIAMLGTAGSGWSAQSRQSSDGLTTDSSGPNGTPPGWVRVVRAGNVVTASHSYDGNTWSVVSSHTVAMSSSVYVGLAVTGHNGDGATARATFQNVTVQGTIVGSPGPSPTPPAGSPPSGWASSDIGNPAGAGAVSIANGTFTVTGGGSDIWHRADQFQFVYQAVAGDVAIVARIASLSAADPWAKAGVMIRQSLTPGSPHIAMLGTAGSGWSAQGRQSSDGLTTDSSGPSGTPPGWVRLVRAGNVVTASHSYDGNTWSVVSSDTVAMSSSVYVGLAVTGHNGDGATARATFQNVTVSLPTSTVTQPPAPTAPTPTRIVFVPSGDHAAAVTSYSVSLRGAGQTISAAPVATRNLGKPSVVNGEIEVDISSLVDPLASGSYYAVVSATGPGGSSSSTPSPTFAK